MPRLPFFSSRFSFPVPRTHQELLRADKSEEVEQHLHKSVLG